MFRQAMRSPVIMFHVVPSSLRAHYEQLSHAERNPSFHSGRFSPDSLSGVDHSSQRITRHGSQTHPHPATHTHPDPNNGYPHLTHPAVSAAKPPTGHTHSPQRALTSTPTTGYMKKVGRRLNIQLKKGEVKICRMTFRRFYVFGKYIDQKLMLRLSWKISTGLSKHLKKMLISVKSFFDREIFISKCCNRHSRL